MPVPIELDDELEAEDECQACAHCAQPLPTHAGECPHCHRDQESLGEPCSYCGRSLPADVAACPYCRHYTDGQGQYAGGAATSRGWLRVLAIALALLALALFLMR